jgi:hypothetical protein
MTHILVTRLHSAPRLLSRVAHLRHQRNQPHMMAPGRCAS